MSQSLLHGELAASPTNRVQPTVVAVRIALIVDGLAFATSAALIDEPRA
jgi:hypothetical protein